MNRRHFLHTTGGVMAGMALGSGRLVDAAAPTASLPLKRIGLELWSVRKAMAKDFDRTLAAVRQIGYTDVELLWSMNNFGKSTAEVKAALQREGLKAPSYRDAIQNAALIAIARSNDTTFIGQLQEMLGDNQLVARVLGAFASRGNQHALDVLNAGANDRRSWVRTWSRAQLAAIKR